MKFVIETARDQHLVKDESTLRTKHATSIANLVSKGRRLQLHKSDEPKIARVNRGVWVFDCDCGSGVSPDPDFLAAYCFGCGAIHTGVVFPRNRGAIEKALLARPKTENRNWNPDETVEDLLKDNDEHGVKP